MTSLSLHHISAHPAFPSYPTRHMAESPPKSALKQPAEILAELGEESDEYDDIEASSVLAAIRS